MARKFTEQDTLYVSRLVYDVLVFTLAKCGLPRSCIPRVTWKENVYRRADLVMIAGMSALRASLFMRDKWRQMFISRRNSSGIRKEGIPAFLLSLITCCPLYQRRTLQTLMEVSIGLSNELMMFSHHEGIDIKLDIFINVVTNIVLYSSQNRVGPNLSKAIEEPFDQFDSILEHTKWLTDFITKYAIPYGFRDDVSDNFSAEYKKRRKHHLKVTNALKESPLRELLKKLGFLPHDIFTAFYADDSVSLPEVMRVPLEWTLPGDRESPEPPESGKGAVVEKKSLYRRTIRSKNEQVDKSVDRIKKSSESEIEEDFRKVNMDVEFVLQESEQGKTKRKKNKKRK